MIAADFLHWSSHHQKNTTLLTMAIQMATKNGILEGYLSPAFLLAAQDMVEIRFLFMAQQQDLATVIAHDENCRIVWPFSRQQCESHIDAWIDVSKSHKAERNLFSRLLIKDMVISMQLQDGLLHCRNI